MVDEIIVNNVVVTRWCTFFMLCLMDLENILLKYINDI